jgi:Domain of unknown function DUF1828
MKELLCNAFCASLDIRGVPAGYAVRTPYDNADGDPLLVYFVREGHSQWRIEDDGTQVPLLEANGVDLSRKARGGAFETLLAEYGAQFDKEARTVYVPALPESELGTAAVRFVGLLLRLQDLSLLTPQIVRSTFKEDALAAIHSAFDNAAEVREWEAISPDLVGQEADVIIRPRSLSAPAPPMAVYLATSEERALQALVAKMEAEKYRRIDGRFVLLVERAKANPVKEHTYSLAMSRLDRVVSFREAPQDVMETLTRLAGVPASTTVLQ